MKSNSFSFICACLHWVFLGLFLGTEINVAAQTVQKTADESSPLAVLYRRWGHPDGEAGLSQGVSAAYIARVGDILMMVGGCNFPDQPAAEGGKKRFYRGVYAAQVGERGSLRWRCIGQLPQASAYGVAVADGESMLCAGGQSEHGAHTTVFRLTPIADSLCIEHLPDLPIPMDNMAGALVGRKWIVAGGMQNGVPGKCAFSLDLDHPEQAWTQLPDFPGRPRVQPVAAAWGSSFALWGGFSPKTVHDTATVATEGLCYDFIHRRWSSLPPPLDLEGRPLAAAGAAAINLTDGSVLLLGGVNTDVFLRALNHPTPDYLRHPNAWYRFNPLILRFAHHRWTVIAQSERTARAGSALTSEPKRLWILGGELRPGVRTPEIYEGYLN